MASKILGQDVNRSTALPDVTLASTETGQLFEVSDGKVIGIVLATNWIGRISGEGPERVVQPTVEITEADVQVSLVTDIESGISQAMATGFIEAIKSGNSPLLIGPEFEFSVALGNGDKMREGKLIFLQNLAMELLPDMREIAIDPPVNSLADLENRLLVAFRDILQTANREVVVVSCSAFQQKDVSLMVDESASLRATDPLPHGPYIDFMTKAHLREIILPNLTKVPQAVRERWLEIVSRLGFENLEDFVTTLWDHRYWACNSFQVSLAIPTTEDGLIPEDIATSTTNLLTFFAPIIDAPCFSGGTAFGQAVLDTEDNVVDDVVDDARTALKGIFPSALPQDFLDGGAMRANIVDQVVGGRIHTVDRAAGTVTFDDGTVIPSTHSITRVRSGVTLERWQCRESNPITTQRIEYVSRGSTPNIAKYQQSVAIQYIVHLAGIMSVRDGITNVFEWLEQVCRREDICEGIETSIMEQRFNEFERANVGQFDEDKVAILRRLINVVRSDFDHLEEMTHICRLAEQGVNALVNSVLPPNDMGATNKWDWFKGNVANVRNWGHFKNSLSSDEIRQIVSTRWEQSLFTDMERGELEEFLDHMCLELFT